MTPNTPTPVVVNVSSWLTLRWTRGPRYYRVHLEQNLWRQWMLTQVNGQIGSARGAVRTHTQPSIDAALARLTTIAKRRRQRGYQLDTPR